MKIGMLFILDVTIVICIHCCVKRGIEHGTICLTSPYNKRIMVKFTEDETKRGYALCL